MDCSVEHEKAFFQVELSEHEVCPRFYRLRHANRSEQAVLERRRGEGEGDLQFVCALLVVACRPSDYLRSWIVAGSPDGKQWYLLGEHTRDSTLRSPGMAHIWAVHTPHSRAHNDHSSSLESKGVSSLHAHAEDKFYRFFRVQLTDVNSHGTGLGGASIETETTQNKGEKNSY